MHRVPSTDALRDLVSFVQFKNRENNPWRSATFIKGAGLSLKLYQKYYSCMGIFHFF